MKDPYPIDAPMEKKVYEELRCLRCVLERILKRLDEKEFVYYTAEKLHKKLPLSKEEMALVDELTDKSKDLWAAIVEVLEMGEPPKPEG